MPEQPKNSASSVKISRRGVHLLEVRLHAGQCLVELPGGKPALQKQSMHKGQPALDDSVALIM